MLIYRYNLGLGKPWDVGKVELDVLYQRIDV